MKKLLIISSIIILSCSKDSEDKINVCYDNNNLYCASDFYIDTENQPNAYKDDNNFWHIEFGLEKEFFFIIKGVIDKDSDYYTSNLLEAPETTFDSDTWAWRYRFTFKVPNYQPFAPDDHKQFFIPYRDMLGVNTTLCYMRVTSDILNVSNYLYQDKTVRGLDYKNSIMGSAPEKSFTPELRVKGFGIIPDTIRMYIKTIYKLEGQDDIPLDFQAEVRSPSITWKEFRIVIDK